MPPRAVNTTVEGQSDEKPRPVSRGHDSGLRGKADEAGRKGTIHYVQESLRLED